MKKITLALIACTLFVTNAIAQPAFTTADMPDIGDQDTVLVNNAYNTTANLDAETGNGYTWDFSSVTFLPNFFDLNVYRVKTHAVSSNSAFDEATIEFYSTGVTAENLALYSYSNDTQYIHRRGGITQGQNFVPRLALVKFPIAFGQASVVTSPTYVGSMLNGEKKTTTTYDGYGTLILPGNLTHTNVFRVKQVEEDTSYIFNSATSTFNYTWYKEGGAVPLLRLVYSGVPDYYFLYASKSTGIGTSVNELAGLQQVSVYPNPVNNELTISLDSKDKIEETIIYDISGKVIRSYNDGGAVIKTGELASGTYFLRVATTKGSYSASFIKQ